jgi:peptidoglycan/LPS O-acetylase OafA/YrhL
MVAASRVILILALVRLYQRPALVGLEARAFDVLGRISYGLYVYHPAVIHLLATVWISDSPSGWNTAAIFLTAFGLTVGVAGLSHRFFERPFLRWKDRFAVVRSGS